MDNRTLVLCPDTEIDGAVVKEFLESFAVLDATKGPIKVVICSEGGWSNGGVAIFDAIQHAKNRVTTVALGTVGSVAVLVFQAGHHRVIAPNAVIYLHETSLHAEDGLSRMKQHLVETERLHKQYCNLIAKRAGIDPETVEVLCRKESFVPPELALKLKLADETMGEIKPKRKKQ